MALTDAERLRQMLGEGIPEGGSASDTLFTDREIDDFLERAPGSLDGAAYYGWGAKAGVYANMADVQEGTSREALGKLHEKAIEREKHFGVLSGLMPSQGRFTRIGRVVRD